MKRNILACAALACATAAHAADFGEGSPAWQGQDASNAVSGDVSFYGGAWLFDGESAGVFGGAGRFALPFGNSWGFQGDLLGDAFFQDGFSFSTLTLLGHLYKMGPAGAIGVKVGTTSAGFHGLLVGGEGHLFLSPELTLGADLNTTFVDGGQFYQARGLARFYFNPNLRLQVEAAWLGISSGGPPDLWSAGGSLTYRPAGSIFSFTGQASYTDIVGGGFGATRLTGGVTINFDDPNSTVLSHDRQNVIFDVSPLFMSIL
jgi:hypothetical protein